MRDLINGAGLMLGIGALIAVSTAYPPLIVGAVILIIIGLSANDNNDNDD
jgi:hypothetical protein